MEDGAIDAADAGPRTVEDIAQPFSLHPSALQPEAFVTIFSSLKDDGWNSSCTGRPAGTLPMVPS